MKRYLGLSVFLAAFVGAHPMGNFSVSHYSRIEVRPQGLAIRYVLDLAEIPTFQLLQQWKLEAGSPRPELESRAAGQAQEWVRNLKIASNGRRLAPHFEGASLVLDKGAGGLPIVRDYDRTAGRRRAWKVDLRRRQLSGPRGLERDRGGCR